MVPWHCKIVVLHRNNGSKGSQCIWQKAVGNSLKTISLWRIWSVRPMQKCCGQVNVSCIWDGRTELYVRFSPQVLVGNGNVSNWGFIPHCFHEKSTFGLTVYIKSNSDDLTALMTGLTLRIWSITSAKSWGWSLARGWPYERGRSDRQYRGVNKFRRTSQLKCACVSARLAVLANRPRVEQVHRFNKLARSQPAIIVQDGTRRGLPLHNSKRNSRENVLHLTRCRRLLGKSTTSLVFTKPSMLPGGNVSCARYFRTFTIFGVAN